ncbi:hypothetical protein [Burkholderia plantarii]|uniref:hypothetical protein n=1 Tax=Burkholderia plantarii TaxID=41899 RepID=UPI0018DC4A0A|nr:hypothetical protein [Burkholderia plantarii]MBI0330647.1 hypothetical protein [Burkholderia plantarii]
MVERFRQWLIACKPSIVLSQFQVEPLLLRAASAIAGFEQASQACASNGVAHRTGIAERLNH